MIRSQFNELYLYLSADCLRRGCYAGVGYYLYLNTYVPKLKRAMHAFIIRHACKGRTTERDSVAGLRADITRVHRFAKITAAALAETFVSCLEYSKRVMEENGTCEIQKNKW